MLKKAKGDQPIIDPALFRLIKRPVAKSVLLIFARDILEKAVDQLGYNKNRSVKLLHHKYYPPPQSGLPGIAGPAIGSPVAVGLGEILIALGAKHILGFGACGSLVSDMKIGEFFIPTLAHSEEGTSKHYIPEQTGFATNGDMTKKLESHLSEKGIKYRFGPIWTTDGFYRETADKVSAYGAKGVMAVDMETSALCALADYRSVDFASLMVVSDELGTGRWVPGFKLPSYKKAIGRGITILSDFDF